MNLSWFSLHSLIAVLVFIWTSWQLSCIRLIDWSIFFCLFLINYIKTMNDDLRVPYQWVYLYLSHHHYYYNKIASMVTTKMFLRGDHYQSNNIRINKLHRLSMMNNCLYQWVNNCPSKQILLLQPIRPISNRTVFIWQTMANRPMQPMIIFWAHYNLNMDTRVLIIIIHPHPLHRYLIKHLLSMATIVSTHNRFTWQLFTTIEDNDVKDNGKRPTVPV